MSSLITTKMPRAVVPKELLRLTQTRIVYLMHKNTKSIRPISKIAPLCCKNLFAIWRPNPADLNKKSPNY